MLSDHEIFCKILYYLYQISQDARRVLQIRDKGSQNSLQVSTFHISNITKRTENLTRVKRSQDFLQVCIWVIPQESGNFRGEFETYFIYLRLNFFLIKSMKNKLILLYLYSNTQLFEHFLKKLIFFKK